MTYRLAQESETTSSTLLYHSSTRLTSSGRSRPPWPPRTHLLTLSSWTSSPISSCRSSTPSKTQQCSPTQMSRRTAPFWPMRRWGSMPRLHGINNNINGDVWYPPVLFYSLILLAVCALLKLNIPIKLSLELRHLCPQDSRLIPSSGLVWRHD